MFRDGLRGHHIPPGARLCVCPTDRQRRFRCRPPSGLPGAKPRGVLSYLSRVCAYPPRPHAPSFDASGQHERHMPCRRRGCAEVRATSGEKHRMKTSTLNACGSDRPRRRRVGRGTTRCPWAGLTSCYRVDGRRWILLARPGSGRHTGQAMENVAGSPDRRGETGPMQPAQMSAYAAWRSRWAWPAARSAGSAAVGCEGGWSSSLTRARRIGKMRSGRASLARRDRDDATDS
jgi:hypothetical protein